MVRHIGVMPHKAGVSSSIVRYRAARLGKLLAVNVTGGEANVSVS
jgi:hypothetical protein